MTWSAFGKWALKNWIAILIAFVAIGLYGLGHHKGKQSQVAKTEKVQAKFDAYKDAVKAAVERQLVQNGLKEAEDKRVFAEIAQKYKQDKLDAKAKSDAVIAGLRAGTIKLRKQWRGCSVATEAADGSSGVDEEAELRMQDAGAAIGDSDWADAWIEGLQEVIRQLQAGPVE